MLEILDRAYERAGTLALRQAQAHALVADGRLAARALMSSTGDARLRAGYLRQT